MKSDLAPSPDRRVTAWPPGKLAFVVFLAICICSALFVPYIVDMRRRSANPVLAMLPLVLVGLLLGAYFRRHQKRQQERRLEQMIEDRIEKSKGV